MVSVAMFLTIHAVGEQNRKKTMKYKSNFKILIVSVLCEFKYSYLMVTILFIYLFIYLSLNFYSFLALHMQEEISEEIMGVHETCNKYSSLHWVFRANTFVC